MPSSSGQVMSGLTSTNLKPKYCINCGKKLKQGMIFKNYDAYSGEKMYGDISYCPVRTKKWWKYLSNKRAEKHTYSDLGVRIKEVEIKKYLRDKKTDKLTR